jgi:C4-dicarboxylate transporter DctQ subunit
MMKLWDRAERAAVGLLGLAALGIALWQVVTRYAAPGASIGYAEEAIVYLVVWAVMIVSSQLVRTDSHVRPDLFNHIMPARVARWLEVFNCIAAIAFSGALVWYGAQIVDTALRIDEHSLSDLQFPMWIYYAALPAGGGLMLLRYVIRLHAVVTSDAAAVTTRPGAHELTQLE